MFKLKIVNAVEKNKQNPSKSFSVKWKKIACTGTRTLEVFKSWTKQLLVCTVCLISSGWENHKMGNCFSLQSATQTHICSQTYDSNWLNDHTIFVLYFLAVVPKSSTKWNEKTHKHTHLKTCRVVWPPIIDYSLKY